MKRARLLKRLTLLIVALCFLFSCDETVLVPEDDQFRSNANDPCDAYELNIIIKDKSGNDLVYLLKDDWSDTHYGMVNPDLYSLYLKKTSPNVWQRRTFYKFGKIVSDQYYPAFVIRKLSPEDEYFSLYDINTLWSADGWQDSLTYRITCPTIFGDSLSHDIVAYFGKDPYAYRRTILTWPECTKVLFDGKEMPVKSVLYDEANELATNIVEIVLDR